MSSSISGHRVSVFVREAPTQSLDPAVVCFAVKRLRNGFHHLFGTNVRLDLHESNTATEMQTTAVRN